MFRAARRLTIVRTEVVFVSHEVEQCAEIGRVGGHQPKEQREQAGDRQLKAIFQSPTAISVPDIALVAHKIEEASGWIATVNITVTLMLLAPVV
jgi:hypothetical protein